MALTELKINTSSPPIMSIDEDKVIFKINRRVLSQVNKNLKNGRKPFLISESNLHVKNTSSHYIAVRVRATKRKFYYVDPTYVILSPGESKNYRFLYFTNLKEEISSEGHKFKFEGFIIQQNEIELKDVFNLCQEYIKKEIKVKGNVFKLGVKFEDDNYYQLPRKKEHDVSKKRNKNIIKEEKNENDDNKDEKDEKNLKGNRKKVTFFDDKKEQNNEKLETINDKIKENTVNNSIKNKILYGNNKNENNVSEIKNKESKTDDKKNLDPKVKSNSNILVIIIVFLLLLFGIRLIK